MPDSQTDPNPLFEYGKRPQDPPVIKPVKPKKQPSGVKKFIPIDRGEAFFRAVVIEELVAPDHKVRAIWELASRLDLREFTQGIKTQEGAAGRAAWNPQLLLAIWIYAYTEGMTSAREVARVMEYEPALMWLTAVGEVNYHTLSSFRADHPEALKEVMSQVLGVLSKEGMVKLERVAHDGTKVRAQASNDTQRREKTLKEEIAKADQVIEELDKQRETEGEPEPGKSRRDAAQERAARDRKRILESATVQLEEIRASKATEKDKQEARVSLTEPEARVMKMGESGFGFAYNVQISVDVEKKVIVGIDVNQSSSDSDGLKPAMDTVKEMNGCYPGATIADGGFTNQKTIHEMNECGIEMYGSMPEVAVREAASMKAAGIDVAFAPSKFERAADGKSVTCPAGKQLPYVRQSKKRDVKYAQYQAQAADCGRCEYQKQCNPKGVDGRLVSIRVEENAEVAAFREKMKTEEAKKIYKQRGSVAEFPNLWIKEKFGLRKFRLRGLAKVKTEALLAALTYNVQRFVLLIWKPKQAALAAAAVAA